MSAVISGGRPKNTYEAGFSGSVLVPDGVSYLRIIAQAPGGSGLETALGGPGGGGGAWGMKEIAVLDTEWGTTLSVTVGSAVAGADGQDVTISGTLNGSSFSCTAQGGQVGTALLSDGLGGVASGFDTNIDGYPGTGYVPSPPDEAVAGVGGAGGGFDQELSDVPTIGGYGREGTITGAGVLAGYEGSLTLEWG